MHIVQSTRNGQNKGEDEDSKERAGKGDERSHFSEDRDRRFLAACYGWVTDKPHDDRIHGVSAAAIWIPEGKCQNEREEAHPLRVEDPAEQPRKRFRCVRTSVWIRTHDHDQTAGQDDTKQERTPPWHSRQGNAADRKSGSRVHDAPN